MEPRHQGIVILLLFAVTRKEQWIGTLAASLEKRGLKSGLKNEAMDDRRSVPQVAKEERTTCSLLCLPSVGVRGLDGLSDETAEDVLGDSIRPAGLVKENVCDRGVGLH